MANLIAVAEHYNEVFLLCFGYNYYFIFPAVFQLSYSVLLLSNLSHVFDYKLRCFFYTFQVVTITVLKRQK